MVRVLQLLCALAVAAAPVAAQCPSSLGDVSPGILDLSGTWMAEGDGAITVNDAAAVADAVVGDREIAWGPEPSCPQTLGDVAPGTLDERTTPAAWIPAGDGERDLADVIALLRSAATGTPIRDGITWWKDVKVITDDRCARCHSPGNIGPFPLTAYEEVWPLAAWIEEVVRDREMPPWPPSDDCAPLEHSRALSDEDRATMLAWIASGTPEGDPADEPEPRPGPDAVVYDTRLDMPEPYTPREGYEDDYRCFLLDWPFAEEAYVTGMQTLADRREQVHHVIAFAVFPWEVAAAEALDAADPEPGWECFGDAGVTAYWVGAWAPGERGGGYPEGTGIRMLPGTKVVMQVHYNMENGPPVPDRSSLELRTADAVAQRAFMLLQVADGFYLPAGDPDVTYAEEFSGTDLLHPLIGAEIGVAPGDPFRVRLAGLHMHQLGTETSLEIVRAGGSEECLLEIPAWDFHWQGVYELSDSVLVDFNDAVRLRCTWDNSPENQPVIGGVQQPPRDVTWGDGSSDEMCLGILYVTAP